MSSGGTWVVVLNWNGRADTEECVASLRRWCPGAQVLVVDNGSTDDLAEVYPAGGGVELLRLAENRGYTGGNNAGIKAALGRGAEVVCVLNNDTVAGSDFLTPLATRARDGAVAVSPVITYATDDGTWFAGGVLDRSGGDLWPRHAAPEELAAAVGGRRESPLLTGCCLVASRATWRRVGLFDDRFFLNFEDMEWSVRARRAGVGLEVLTGATLAHKVSRSFTGYTSVLGTYYYHRNALLFNELAAPHSRRARLRWAARRALRPAVSDLARRRDGGARAVMTGLALRDHLRGRYGPAPAGVLRCAVRSSTP